MNAKKTLLIRNATLYATYLLIVWGFYRLLFQFPDPFDEILIKPIIWLIPIAIFLKKEKSRLSSIGITQERLFSSIYFSLILGSLFAFEGFIINYAKGVGFNTIPGISSSTLYAALGISFITAISEELAFRGFIFTRLENVFSNEWKSVFITTCLWTLIHIPQAIFDWHLSFYNGLLYVIFVFVFGFGSNLIFARTKNIMAPILLHVMWAWPIILFR